jgi:hypothetical protein
MQSMTQDFTGCRADGHAVARARNAGLRARPLPDPAVKEFQRLVDAAYARYKGLQDGKNADYIPILTETPSDLFGVVIVTKDGKVYSAGDVDYQFSIQSVSKPFTAALVMTQQGPAVLKEKIGVEPTGMVFNSKLALDLRALGQPAGQRRRDRRGEPGAGDVRGGPLEPGARRISAISRGAR